MAVSITEIQRAVADLYGLPAEIMQLPDGRGNRERAYARPRQVAMYLSRKFCGSGNYRSQASFTAIGKRFGGRDHSTILHGCRQVERFMLADTEERRAVGEIGLMFIERAESQCQ